LQNTFFECLVLDVPSALTTAPPALVRDAVALGAISPEHLDGTFGTELARAEGGKIDAVTFTTDHAAGGDGFIGEFTVPCTPVAGSTLTAATGAWLQGRAGRRLRLTMGDVEVEATSTGELYGLLNLTMAVTERHENPATDHV